MPPVARSVALVAALAMTLSACSSGIDQATARQLQQTAGVFEPPEPWERLDKADGPYADEGFPDLLLIGDEFGTPTSDCPAGDDVRCLQLQRVWQLDPDDLDPQTQVAPPLLPAHVEELREAITATEGWDVAQNPDCILDQDTAAAMDDACTWRAVDGDVEVVLRPHRRDSTQPWQLELYVHDDSYAYEIP